MPISQNQGECVYDTRRTVTWERDALALNIFTSVYYALRAIHALILRFNSQSDFAGNVPIS